MSQSVAAKKVNDLQKKMKVDAENLIFQQFPERIIELNEILNKPEFRNAEDIKSTLNIPTTMKIENNINNCEGTTLGACLDSNTHDKIQEQMLIPSNKKLTEIIKIFKRYNKQLFEDINAIEVWLILLRPKIEDGNNFGVSVQKEVLKLINMVKIDASNYLELVLEYYVSRGKLITKVVKFPFVEDYQRTVEEIDEKLYSIISITLRDICHHYSELHDIFIKNIENIKKPRSSNTDSLY